MLGTCLENVRKTVPLVHNITNYVTVNDVYDVTFSPLDAEFGAAYELTEAAVADSKQLSKNSEFFEALITYMLNRIN